MDESGTGGQYRNVSHQSKRQPLWIRVVVIAAVLFILLALVAAAIGR